jgi:hypothetical protein
MLQRVVIKEDVRKITIIISMICAKICGLIAGLA